jgi:hypothetical protein
MSSSVRPLATAAALRAATGCGENTSWNKEKMAGASGEHWSRQIFAPSHDALLIACA